MYDANAIQRIVKNDLTFRISDRAPVRSGMQQKRDPWGSLHPVG